MTGRIERLLAIEDGGPAARCPHCGCAGRWIYTFRLESGETAAAMAGCYRAWPKSRRYDYDYGRILKREQRTKRIRGQ